MPELWSRTRGCHANRIDGGSVNRFIMRRILRGARAFAKHVERTECLFALGPGERIIDGFAKDELFAHHPDCSRHGLTDDRLANARNQPPEIGWRVILGTRINIDNLAGQHQPPG